MDILPSVDINNAEQDLSDIAPRDSQAKWNMKAHLVVYNGRETRYNLSDSLLPCKRVSYATAQHWNAALLSNGKFSGPGRRHPFILFIPSFWHKRLFNYLTYKFYTLQIMQNFL